MTKARNIANLASDGSALADGTINYTDVSGTPTLATVATSGAYADVTGTPTLAAVATTGAYADVTGTPAAALPLTGGTLSGAVTVVGSTNAATFRSASTMYQAQLKVIDTTALAANTGGKISFMGVYNSGGGETEYGQIQGIKENATDGDFAGALAFYSRANAANPAERMRIDSSGAVTMPYQPAFLAIPTGGQHNFPINAQTTVDFANEIFDQGNNFSSNTFTAPVSGRYQFSVMLYANNMDTATDYYQCQLVTSNRTYSQIVSSNRYTADLTYYSFAVSILVDMDAGDTASVKIDVPNSGTAQLDLESTASRFSGYLVA